MPTDVDQAAGSPPRVAVVGVGGYAGDIIRLLLRNPDQLTLAAVCDPDPTRLAEARETYAEHELAFYDGIDAMLDALPADVVGVWLPVPIHLHVDFTRKVLASGRAVMLEKPVAGSVQQVDEIIALADAARPKLGVSEPVCIGYQHMYQPSTRLLKQALVGGRIGKVESAKVLACWPRDSIYYGRNDWAGAVKRHGTFVLDSPANNALAHVVNVALFFLGQEAETPADVQRVEAELVRVNEIENFDTCGLRILAGGDRRLLVLLTHACGESVRPQIHLQGSRGKATWDADGTLTLGGPVRDDEKSLRVSFGDRTPMLRGWRQVLRGEAALSTDGPLATPQRCRPQTLVVNAASQAAAVRTIEPPLMQTHELGDGVTRRQIVGIEADFQRCFNGDLLPSEAGLDWAAPGGAVEVDAGWTFSGPKA
jgi:predicted dehydrogenase